MTEKGGLYACKDSSSWEAVLNIYQDVIEAMGSKKKKLIALDQWYQEELPKILTGREEKYLTKEELLKLMEWKLTRGKFRPRLQQLLAANPSKMVEEHTRKAFQRLPDVEAAVKELSELKGVGPATASGTKMARLQINVRLQLISGTPPGVVNAPTLEVFRIGERRREENRK
uniref:Uncharacterized protein n=1 Tax=Pseudonaja textilis TaxID=8673 RepID=A0A670ZIT2_PSETE